uniref:Uncharacterized protein n=1 Tax=Rhizophora mucronata TaxID=61149 RepID=A0A2P2PK56_RHIMU
MIPICLNPLLFSKTWFPYCTVALVGLVSFQF